MLLLIKVSWWSDWRSMFFSFYNKHFLLFPLLCAIFPSIMRVLSSLSETEDWTTLSRYRSTTFASDRIVIYRVCTRERPYLRAYVVPAGCRYRDMGKLKFYDDTANGCMCPLLNVCSRDGRYPYPFVGIRFLTLVSFFQLSCSSLLALHVQAKWLSYSPTYTASPRALLTWFLMRIGRFAESKQPFRLCKENVFRSWNVI